MVMTLQELLDTLQTRANEGHAQDEVVFTSGNKTYEPCIGFYESEVEFALLTEHVLTMPFRCLSCELRKKELERLEMVRTAKSWDEEQKRRAEILKRSYLIWNQK